ncbi:OmpA/MotB family protein [Pseudodesulfovibrio senegalensis]|jgi:chemotaxis protein MotB|uniref:Flagellar motor protein MotB n=1 Tax=Pseudodesulfovibrio senegalensis TaxID=1721087 RepID=A0A6N6MZF0_9BACT|nr:flagellar motor protein MotB [Pseudodesulfovibrio senegalensis]KAB1441081.1 flagellar motor protein MotB [Pseudodesulfovibrio senegalensis]
MAKDIEEIIEKKEPAPPPPEEGLPPWMATFADMVTLLLCFFVLLLSFANQNVEKFRDALGSIQGAFGVHEIRAKSEDMALVNTSSDAKKAVAKISHNERVFLGVIMRIKSLFENEDVDIREGTGVTSDRDGVVFNTRVGLLFEPNSARLKPEASSVLDKIVKVLKDYKLNLVVRGHSDDTPVHTKAYPSNWELSAARAAVALNYILKKGGFPISRAKAVGYADTRPIAPNDTPENRFRNQRVEFYLHMPQRDAW